MAEAIRTSASRWKNFSMTASSGLASICPCAMTMRASGTNLLQPGADPLHGLHPIVDKVDLAAASELAKNGLPNRLSR